DWSSDVCSSDLSAAVSVHADRHRSRSSAVQGSAFDQMLWVAHGAERNPSLLPIYLSYEIRFVTSLLDFRKSFRYSREDCPARCYTWLEKRCAETALLLLQFFSRKR